MQTEGRGQRHDPSQELTDVLLLRVRYSETDQMGTFYNSRALEWFECGRTELMRRRLGRSYATLEAAGVFLPLVEAHLEFQGPARYDDLLRIESTVSWSGRAQLRFRSGSRTPRQTGRSSRIHAARLRGSDGPSRRPGVISGVDGQAAAAGMSPRQNRKPGQLTRPMEDKCGETNRLAGTGSPRMIRQVFPNGIGRSARRLRSPSSNARLSRQFAPEQALIRWPLANRFRSNFSLGECALSSGRAKPSSRVSAFRIARN